MPDGEEANLPTWRRRRRSARFIQQISALPVAARRHTQDKLVPLCAAASRNGFNFYKRDEQVYKLMSEGKGGDCEWKVFI